MQQLCAWMRDLKLNYSATAFEKEEIDGTELADYSQADFISVVTSVTGAIADITLVPVDSYFSQLVTTLFLVVNFAVPVPRRRACAS